MLVTPANLSFFFTQLETRFWSAYEVAQPWSSKVADIYPAPTEQFIAGWIGMVDKYRQWLGSRTTHSPAPQTYAVQIQNFELTEAIDQFKLMDDQYGIYFPTVSFMGMQAKKVYDYQLRDLLFNQGSQTGSIQNGFDGLTHFNTAHPVDFYDSTKGTYSNDFRGGFTVNGVTVGGALSTIGFNSLWEEIASRKSESGEALGLMADCTMVPPQLKATGMTILQSNFYAPSAVSAQSGHDTFVGAMDNVLKGWTDLEVNADLAALPTTWFMSITKGPVKPYGIALNSAPDFVYRVNPQDPTVFDTHTYTYGSMARFAPFWGYSWLDAISSP
jgi:phage major head subunit gpT-like protein